VSSQFCWSGMTFIFSPHRRDLYPIKHESSKTCSAFWRVQVNSERILTSPSEWHRNHLARCQPLGSNRAPSPRDQIETWNPAWILAAVSRHRWRLSIIWVDVEPNNPWCLHRIRNVAKLTTVYTLNRNRVWTSVRMDSYQELPCSGLDQYFELLHWAIDSRSRSYALDFGPKCFVLQAPDIASKAMKSRGMSSLIPMFGIWCPSAISAIHTQTSQTQTQTQTQTHTHGTRTNTQHAHSCAHTPTHTQTHTQTQTQTQTHMVREHRHA